MRDGKMLPRFCSSLSSHFNLGYCEFILLSKKHRVKRWPEEEYQYFETSLCIVTGGPLGEPYSSLSLPLGLYQKRKALGGLWCSVEPFGGGSLGCWVG